MLLSPEPPALCTSASACVLVHLPRNLGEPTIALLALSTTLVHHELQSPEAREASDHSTAPIATLERIAHTNRSNQLTRP